MRIVEDSKQKVGRFDKELYVPGLSCEDPGTPFRAKAFAALLAGCAFRPIDLISDLILVPGYLFGEDNDAG